MDQWLEQEGVFIILRFGDKELADELNFGAGRLPGMSCGGWTTGRCGAPTSRDRLLRRAWGGRPTVEVSRQAVQSVGCRQASIP